MQVRWTGEPRALANPQIEVAPGDVIDLPDITAESLVEQGLAERAAKSKKETA
jgi:hypothetical protein